MSASDEASSAFGGALLRSKAGVWRWSDGTLAKGVKDLTLLAAVLPIPFAYRDGRIAFRLGEHAESDAFIRQHGRQEEPSGRGRRRPWWVREGLWEDFARSRIVGATWQSEDGVDVLGRAASLSAKLPTVTVRGVLRSVLFDPGAGGLVGCVVRGV